MNEPLTALRACVLLVIAFCLCGVAVKLLVGYRTSRAFFAAVFIWLIACVFIYHGIIALEETLP